jgi:hypothetical protein
MALQALHLQQMLSLVALHLRLLQRLQTLLVALLLMQLLQLMCLVAASTVSTAEAAAAGTTSTATGAATGAARMEGLLMQQRPQKLQVALVVPLVPVMVPSVEAACAFGAVPLRPQVEGGRKKRSLSPELRVTFGSADRALQGH